MPEGRGKICVMTDTDRGVERRRHARFKVSGAVFVGFRPHNSRLGEVIDIGMGGLSFRYLATGEPSNGSRRLNIFLTERNFYLNDVLFETVSDFRTDEIPFTPVTMRRSSVQFGELTNSQISRLEYFIENYTTTET
jgi:hypothetical protein